MDGIELMATAMHAAKARLDVAASNLANVSSAGFHKRVARATLTSQGLVPSSVPDSTPGPLRHTGRNFDLAAVGGGFYVRERSGAIVESRSGSFERNARGELVDERGRRLMGAHAPLTVRADATIDGRGNVPLLSGGTGALRLREGTTVQTGFLEGANVDAVGEMVAVLGAQRAFETAQKTLSAIDDERQKAVNDVARVK